MGSCGIETFAEGEFWKSDVSSELCEIYLIKPGEFVYLR